MRSLRCSAVPLFCLLCIAFAAILVPGEASAQLFERATVVENVRLRLSSGRTVDGARIVVRGGRIAQLGPGAEKPMLSRTVDGLGRTVTAGLIDVDSRLALGRGGAGAVARAWDGFDRYDTDGIGEAFAGGVTTVCLVPGGSSGVHGTAAVVRLLPREEGGYGEMVRDDVALCVDLGSGGTPLARLRSFEAIRKQFRDAVKHREAQDDYEAELEEYETALKKWLEEHGDAEEKKGGKGEGKKKGGKKKDQNALDPTLQDPAGKKKDDAKDEKPPKKPTRPRRRPSNDVLLKAIDRELVVRIEAHRSADILNALDLAHEFDLDVVICGATEAHLVTDALVEAEVKVLLEGAAGGEGVEFGPRRRHHSGAAAVLERAGVPWMVGSGGESARATRHLWFHGVRAAQGTKQNPFDLMTTGAARELGIGRRFGRLGRGANADLVFWSADPLEHPSARVLEVWVGGQLAWTAPALPEPTRKGTKL